MAKGIEMSEDSKKGEQEGSIVEFVYLNTNAETKFHASREEKLGEVWNRAYDKDHLNEAKKPTDKLECQSGESLMEYLSLTLEQLRERKICPDRKFQIRSETGGA